MKNDPIIMNPFDLLRLAELLRSSVRQWPFLKPLEEKLRDAQVVHPDEMPPDVVTIGSTVRFTDRRTGVCETYTLVFPAEADLERHRLSVFAPIGTALLGRREGEVVWWQVPSGIRSVRINEVVNQPEALARAGIDSTECQP
jgi:regulator of nucleoside diphosphate kinase